MADDELKGLRCEIRDLDKTLKSVAKLLDPPMGWIHKDFQTTAVWSKVEPPKETAFWIIQNQSAGEAVRYSYTRVETGNTYGLIYAQGSISRTSSPTAIWFRRDGAAGTGPVIVVEFAYWTDEQVRREEVLRSAVAMLAKKVGRV